MSEVTVTGASDDLVEIDGAIYEEFGLPSGEAILAFSEGTILGIEYDDEGIWRIKLIVRGSADLDIKQATADDEDGTDKAILMGDVRWVVLGSEWAKAK